MLQVVAWPRCCTSYVPQYRVEPPLGSSVCPQRPDAFEGPCSREAVGPGACGRGPALPPGGAGAELGSPGAPETCCRQQAATGSCEWG